MCLAVDLEEPVRNRLEIFKIYHVLSESQKINIRESKSSVLSPNIILNLLTTHLAYHVMKNVFGFTDDSVIRY